MADTLTLPALHGSLGTGRQLDVPALTVEHGERLVLFGPNGAGKTTALRMLSGMVPGADSPPPPAVYLPQRPYMFRGTGHHNLTLGLDGEQSRQALELATELGIELLLDQPAATLSGGERTRLALARALAGRASLVLLDEPLAPVDLRDWAAVIDVIADAVRDRVAVIVTHNRSVAAALADRVAVLIDGTLRQVGSVADVFALPADDQVAQVVGVGNLLPGVVARVEGPLVEVNVGDVTVWARGTHAPGTSTRVTFGAESVTVYRDGAMAGSARNVWPGTVTEIRDQGLLVEVIVDVGCRVAALITPGSLEALGLAAGHQVTVSVKATAATAVAAPQA